MITIALKAAPRRDCEALFSSGQVNPTRVAPLPARSRSLVLPGDRRDCA
ncbi:hypothetical protein AB4Z48_04795 [Cupriavidus sp. 2TAF22]